MVCCSFVLGPGRSRFLGRNKTRAEDFRRGDSDCPCASWPGGRKPFRSHCAALLTDLNLQVRALGWGVVTKQESVVMIKAIVSLSFTAARA